MSGELTAGILAASRVKAARRAGRVALALTTVIAAGCASHPAQSPPTAVPDSRILATQWLAPVEGTPSGGLNITRVPRKAGSQCDARVSVDWAATADLKPNETLRLFLPVGHHVINVAPVGACPGGMRFTNVDISRKTSAELHIKYSSSGVISLKGSWQAHFRDSW